MRFLSVREIDKGCEMALMHKVIVGYSITDEKSQKMIMLIYVYSFLYEEPVEDPGCTDTKRGWIIVGMKAIT